jgi:serum/glucocorticoid-regulated kinase 2
MSPEMLSSDYHSRMVDFYSLGALLYEMLVGLPPLYQNDREEMYFNIVNKEPSYPETLSNEALDLL